MDELVEIVGRKIYRAAAVNPFEDVPTEGAIDLARRVLHRDVVCEYDAKTVDRAGPATWGGRRRIAVPSWLSPAKKNWTVAFELGREVLADEFEYRSLDESERKRTELELAGWLTAPTEPLLARYHQVGFDLPALSRAFAVSQTAVALRLHEVTGKEFAIVVGAANDGAIVQEPKVHRRSKQLSWLHDDALHELAKKSNPKRVKKIAIRDAPARTLLVASS